MDSWNKAMGTPSIALPPSLLSSSRKSPISARKMYSDDDEETSIPATDALTKTGSFMTYEQFSKQFEGIPRNLEIKKLSRSILLEIATQQLLNNKFSNRK
jgi:hypothetical protein